MCITWNRAVRKMYSLPYDTHRWILDPLTNQRQISYQLFATDIKLLHSIKYDLSNSTVSECSSCTFSDSNTVIGYKIAFNRENFKFHIFKVILINSCNYFSNLFPIYMYSSNMLVVV